MEAVKLEAETASLAKLNPNGFAVYSENRGSSTIISILGEVVMFNSEQIRKAVREIVSGSSANEFELNLTGTDRIDSTGMGMVVALYKEAKGRKASFGVIVADGDLKETFRYLRLTNLFRVRCEGE